MLFFPAIFSEFLGLDPNTDRHFLGINRAKSTEILSLWLNPIDVAESKIVKMYEDMCRAKDRAHGPGNWKQREANRSSLYLVICP